MHLHPHQTHPNSPHTQKPTPPVPNFVTTQYYQSVPKLQEDASTCAMVAARRFIQVTSVVAHFIIVVVVVTVAVVVNGASCPLRPKPTTPPIAARRPCPFSLIMLLPL